MDGLCDELRRKEVGEGVVLVRLWQYGFVVLSFMTL